jgi:hypothetical protein
MTGPRGYLYNLLPAVYRMRDELQGGPLRELLAVVEEQVNVLEDDIAQLYDNWFIETCDDWVVPYLGDLVGYLPVAEAGAPAGTDPAAAGRRGRVLAPRRDVANTIGFRRRKGTLALLEVLAAAVAGWPARAVESYTLLGWTQHLDHQRPTRGQYADLRSTERLDRLEGPFDDLAHRVDARRPSSHRARGRFNIPSVALWLWRLGSYPVTRAPAACIEREGTNCYTFSVLGNDTPLFNRPVAEPDPAAIAEETNLPTPIRRRAFERRLSERPLVAVASPAYYGPGKSVSVEVGDWPRRGRGGPVPAEDVIPADLSDWHGYQAPRGKVLLDPERGRLVFAPGQAPKRVVVSYRYGFPADLGGGEYRRPVSQPAQARHYRVRQRDTGPGEFRSIQDAYARWRHDKQHPDPGGPAPRAAVLEVADSGVYEERLVFDLDPGESLQLRSAPGSRPVLRLLDYRVDQPDPFSVSGGRASRFTLDGFLVTGRGIQVVGAAPAEEGDAGGEEAAEAGELCDVTIRHTTLVPGWELDCDCAPGRPDEPSLTLNDSRARVVVEHSIIGSIRVRADERARDPAPLSFSDSIVDATSPAGLAVAGEDGHTAFVELRVARCTVIGEVAVHAIALAENSIFTSPVRVARRQVGCVRFCAVPKGSRTPRRYRCQPDAAAEDAAAEVRAEAERAAIPVDPAAVTRAQQRARDRVRPAFESLRYGTPVYGRLAEACAEEITLGADDESELGVYHDLYAPQRAASLALRLQEYTPAGMDAGTFHAS